MTPLIALYKIIKKFNKNLTIFLYVVFILHHFEKWNEVDGTKSN